MQHDTPKQAESATDAPQVQPRARASENTTAASVKPWKILVDPGVLSRHHNENDSDAVTVRSFWVHLQHMQT